METIYENLGEDFEPISDILVRIDDPELTASKVVHRIAKLIDAGRAEKTELRIKPADGGRARTLVGYKRV